MTSWGHKPVEPEPASATPSPDVCPACGSSAITTTTKVPDEAAYWRCTACGEIWNAGRRQTTRNPPRRW